MHYGISIPSRCDTLHRPTAVRAISMVLNYNREIHSNIIPVTYGLLTSSISGINSILSYFALIHCSRQILEIKEKTRTTCVQRGLKHIGIWLFMQPSLLLPDPIAIFKMFTFPNNHNIGCFACYICSGGGYHSKPLSVPDNKLIGYNNDEFVPAFSKQTYIRLLGFGGSQQGGTLAS